MSCGHPQELIFQKMFQYRRNKLSHQRLKGKKESGHMSRDHLTYCDKILGVFLLNLLLFTCLISRKPNRSPSFRPEGNGAPVRSLLLVLEFKAWRAHFLSPLGKLLLLTGHLHSEKTKSNSFYHFTTI
jgi:hypothetical protein